MEIADLKEILRILEEQEITEFELEQDGVKLRVCRSAPVCTTAAVAAPALLASAPPAPPAPAAEGATQASSPSAVAPATTAETAGPGDFAVKSPIVGTFYRAPDPNSPPFVDVGARVKIGQVLCIVEAMKLMNEIEAETAGEIVKIHVENGQPVQYGDVLFTVRPV